MQRTQTVLMTAAAVMAVLAGIVWLLNDNLAPPQYDLHDRMRASSKPASDGVQQIQLAHIGHIDTPDGRFEVATGFDVTKGMLAARGSQRLLLFTPEGKLVKQYWESMGQPLWCEGSRIYLELGWNMGGFRMDPVIAAAEPEDSMPTGDVLDFSAGIEDPLITSVERLAAANAAGGGRSSLTDNEVLCHPNR